MHTQAEPTPREIAVLRLISEQVAIPLDQLARFLDLDHKRIARLVESLSEAGCLKQRAFIAADPAWVWLTHRGAQLSQTGFAPIKDLTIRLLTHRRAVNEVRLYVEKRAPAGHWLCERAVESLLDPNVCLPDAVFEIGNERHAIEVELSRKSRSALREVIASHSSRYDAVLYFCSPQTRSLLDKELDREHWPKLVVRDVPGMRDALATRSRGFGMPLRDLRSPAHVRGSPRRKLPRRPKDWERDLLALICEQGALPLDQLARFVCCDSDNAALLATHLCDAKYARRARLLAKEPDWIWLSQSGTRLSRAGFKAYLPAPGALARLRAINEVRLWVEGGDPRARWIGWRTLRREQHGAGQVPNAVVEVGGERHAIEIELTRRTKEDATRMVDHRCANYDAVVCFCTAKTRRYYKRLGDDHHWPKLLIRELPSPGADPPHPPPARWSHCAREFAADARAHRVGRHAHSTSPGSRKLFWQSEENPQRSEVDDRLWSELQSQIPADLRPRPGWGGRRMPDRTALSGIVYVARNEIGWSDLPHELGYGSGMTCLERLRRWERAGVWPAMRQLLKAELEDGERIDWARLAPQYPA